MVGAETCMVGCVVASDYASWIPIIAVAILSVFFLLAMFFMFARILGKREWEALAKAELTQTIAATIWVIIIGGFATAACSVSCSMTKDVSPFTTALDYLSSTRGITESYMGQMISVAKDIRIKSATSYSVFNIYVRPYGGCDIVAGNFEVMGTLFAPFVGSLIVQQYALAIFNNLAFAVLLPIGIVLRVLPFARELGSMLIALAVVLYIVMPLTYVFAKKAMDNVTVPVRSIEAPGDNCINPEKTREIFETIGYVLPQTVFFPALSMLITVTCARALSKVFMYDFQEMV